MPSTSNLVWPATTVLVVSGAMGIPENLKRLREREQLSQAALAKKAGVAQQLISQLERGENLTTKKLPEIARALNATLLDIDPSLRDAISAGTAVTEIGLIYQRLKDHPDWQAYLLDQARQLEQRVLPKRSSATSEGGRWEVISKSDRLAAADADNLNIKRAPFAVRS